MNKQPIDLGPADLLLAEGRLRAKRDQMPFMQALKIVVTNKLIETSDTTPESQHAKDGEGHAG